MSKPSAISPTPPATPRDTLRLLDPVQLLALLDRVFDDDGTDGGSSYQRVYVDALKAFLQ